MMFLAKYVLVMLVCSNRSLVGVYATTSGTWLRDKAHGCTVESTSPMEIGEINGYLKRLSEPQMKIQWSTFDDRTPQFVIELSSGKQLPVVAKKKKVIRETEEQDGWEVNP